MRTLVILRGCPGAGKSTWVRQMGLEPYTLSPDVIRLMRESPRYSEQSDMQVTISQRNDAYVWELLYELLERRMMNGDFVVIDATHSRSTDFSRYNKLAEKYRYRKYFVSFTDIPKEVCKERNATREAYKRVPEEVIDKMYARFETQGKTSGWVEIKRDEFWEVLGNKVIDSNMWNRIHIIGDLHGCYEPLKEYLTNTSRIKEDATTPEELAKHLNEDEQYIFVGDYLDRGIQNKEVLEFMLAIYEKPNIICLEGNHEHLLFEYANDDTDLLRNKEFIDYTVPQICEIDKKAIRQFYRKLRQMSLFTYSDKTYFINHGGLAIIPDKLQLVSTSDLIHGVGRFTYPVDERFTERYKDTNIFQIHGHRNILKTKEDMTDNRDAKSISLEAGVEFGRYLAITQLEKESHCGTDHTMCFIKNDIFREPKEEYEEPIQSDMTSDNIVNRLRLNKYIQENELDDNISAFNFSRTAFERGKWNKETVKARGLFINTETGKIVARGYEKFFNINEQEETKLFNLNKLFNEGMPSVVAYKKYNGFLGILSYYNGKLQFHSKSTNKGNHVEYFSDLFYTQFSEETENKIVEYLKNNNVSLTFEVIDVVNDPHVIKEKQSRLVLLDVIKNEIDFQRLSYKELCTLAGLWGLPEDEYKQVFTEFKSYKELTDFVKEHQNELNFNDTDIEGVVIECGSFMTKLKFNYYNFWKKMRSIAEMVQNGKTNIKLSCLYNATANYFYKFVKEISEPRIALFKELSSSINEDIKEGDLRRAAVDLETGEIKITRVARRERGTGKVLDTKTIVLNDMCLAEKLLNAQKKLDIITLRDMYYDNGGI